MQITKTYSQINAGSPAQVFPLLCPVREHDWIDGWEAEVIHSQSGLAEQGCVFVTPGAHEHHAVWYVTQHDAVDFSLEMVRVTPEVEVTKLNIKLEPLGEDKTESTITYQYTPLSAMREEYLRTNLDDDFQQQMKYWEKAINYYLRTGEKLGAGS